MQQPTTTVVIAGELFVAKGFVTKIDVIWKIGIFKENG